MYESLKTRARIAIKIKKKLFKNYRFICKKLKQQLFKNIKLFRFNC